MGAVDGLGETDFALTDNGRRVRFQLDTADTINAPVALIVAVQTNDMSAAALHALAAANDADGKLSPNAVRVGLGRDFVRRRLT